MVRFDEIVQLKNSERKWKRFSIAIFTLFFTDLMILAFELRREILWDEGRKLEILFTVAAALFIIELILIFRILKIKDKRLFLLNKFYDDE